MEFTIKTKIKASAMEIYTAWLSSDAHSKMTGGIAKTNDKVGGFYTAWDGYIEGKNLKLEPFNRILQSWRTAEFEENEEDSKIEILLNESDEETELSIIHSNLSDNGEHYKKGWEDHYFKPMKKFFSQKL
jgi:activator of HSP90 ATPase